RRQANKLDDRPMPAGASPRRHLHRIERTDVARRVAVLRNQRGIDHRWRHGLLPPSGVGSELGTNAVVDASGSGAARFGMKPVDDGGEVGEFGGNVKTFGIVRDESVPEATDLEGGVVEVAVRKDVRIAVHRAPSFPIGSVVNSSRRRSMARNAVVSTQ